MSLIVICSTSHRQRGVRLLLVVGAVLACVSLYFVRTFFYFIKNTFGLFPHFLVYCLQTEDSNLTNDGSLIYSYGTHHGLSVFTDWGKHIHHTKDGSLIYSCGTHHGLSVFTDRGKDIHHTKHGSLSD